MSWFSLLFRNWTSWLFIIPLFVSSLLVLAVVLERIWVFSSVGRLPRELMRRLEGMLSGGQWQEAQRTLDANGTPYARVVKASLVRQTTNMAEISDMLTVACDYETAAAARPLVILSTIGYVTPFIGLFGTVLGIINAFNAVDKGGAQSLTTAATGAVTTASQSVMAGVAEALIATAIGLAVAIVAVVANNWCNSWVEGYRLELERFATEWSYRLHAVASAVKVTEPTP